EPTRHGGAGGAPGAGAPPARRARARGRRGARGGRALHARLPAPRVVVARMAGARAAARGGARPRHRLGARPRRAPRCRHLRGGPVAAAGGVYAGSVVVALAGGAGAGLLGAGRATARLRPWCARLARPAAVLLATGAYGAWACRLYAASPEGRAVRTVAV